MQEIVKMLFGSRIYGTNLPTSDHDYKVIFIPEAKDIVMGTTKNAFTQTTKIDLSSKSGADDVEVEFFSLKKYLDLLVEGQTVALDMLFTPEEFYISEPHAAWKLIKQNQDKFLHSGVLSFIGYARQQANKYGIKGSRVAASRSTVEFFDSLIEKVGHATKLKDVWSEVEKFVDQGLPHISIIDTSQEAFKNFETRLKTHNVPIRFLEVCNRKAQEHSTLKDARAIFKRVFDEYGARALQAETNENIDWKALMHAVRITSQAKELLLTGKITFPRPDAEFLKEIRTGKISYKEVATIIENGMQELEHIQMHSHLPKQPDFAFKDKLVFDIYTKIVKGEA